MDGRVIRSSDRKSEAFRNYGAIVLKYSCFESFYFSNFGDICLQHSNGMNKGERVTTSPKLRKTLFNGRVTVSFMWSPYGLVFTSLGGSGPG